MTNAVVPNSLADRLKHETADLHRIAESHPWQRDLLQGRVDRAAFAAHQAQMYLVQKDLESFLEHAAQPGGPGAGLVKPYHYRLDRLEADLRVLGVSAPVAPLASTGAFLAWMADAVRADLATVLGVFYVLEGSTNGAKFIAKAIERGLGLSVAEGLSYLDPHGDQLRPRWAQFRVDLDALALTGEQRDAIVDAAGRTFRYVTALMEDLSGAAAARA